MGIRNSDRREAGYKTGSRRPFVAPILVLLLLSVSLISLGLNRRIAADSRDYHENLDTYRLFEIRAEMAWLHLDMLIAGLSAELEGIEPTEAELNVFKEQRAVAIAELTELSLQESLVGEWATVLIGDYSDQYRQGWPYDAFELDSDHYVSTDPDIAALPTPEQRRVDEAIPLSLLPRLVLIDGLVLELDNRQAPVAPWARGFVEYTAEVLRDAPGWVGPERTDPLQDSVMGRGTLPVPTSSLAGYSELQQVWDYDQWLLGLAEDPSLGGTPRGQAPLTINQLQETEGVASASLDSVILQQITATRGEPVEGGLLSETGWLMAAIISGSAALSGAVALFVRRHLQHRNLTDAVFTDSLTGAKNRRYLGEELRDRCLRRHTHHVVAMIDLDRFKMVNDTWGHDVGDRLLIAAAERLGAVVHAVTSPWAQAEGSVVRLGGDEFAVVLHSPDRFALPVLEASLRTVAGNIDVGLDLPVPLELSVGLAESFDPIDIHDLLKGADLAVYRDKRSETEPASDAAPTGPPSLSVDLR